MPQQLLIYGNCVWRPHTILRVFAKPGFSERLFTRLSFDADERTVLARLGRLILIVRPINSHLHAALWRDYDGGSIGGFPF